MPSLYQTYRPTTFRDIRGQKHIVEALTRALAMDRVGHAYLFTGPRGTGKTTLARLLARAVNCSLRKENEPCGKCQSCQDISSGLSMNVIEIDAASYTGVDNIRQIRDEVNIPPINAPKKVYIIDEVHMLSKGAFNALLKTLEEPPKHIIFILATTEVHKVPETIRSRCQQFDLSRLSIEDITAKLSVIAEKESISLTPDALEMIAIVAEGGMRDAESLFSQLISLAKNKKLAMEDIESFLGMADQKSIETFVSLLFQGESITLLNHIDTVVRSGYDPEIFTKRTILFLREVLTSRYQNMEGATRSSFMSDSGKNIAQSINASNSPSRILEVIELLAVAQTKTRTSFLPQLPLEIVAIKCAEHRKPSSFERPSSTQPPTRTSTSSRKPESKREKPEPPSVTPPPKSNVQETETEKLTARTPSPLKRGTPSTISLPSITSYWETFLAQAKERSLALSLLFSNAVPIRVDTGNTLVLSTQFAFHKDKMNDPKNRLTAEDILSKLAESHLFMICMTDEESGYVRVSKKTNESSSEQKEIPGEDVLSSALETFGGTVVET